MINQTRELSRVITAYYPCSRCDDGWLTVWNEEKKEYEKVKCGFCDGKGHNQT